MGTTEKKDVSVKDAAEAFNELAVAGESKLTFDEAFSIMENTPDDVFQEVAGSEKIVFEEGMVYNLVAERIEQTTIKGDAAEVVHLRDKDGQTYVNWDAVLISSIKKVQLLPCFIRVTCRGTIKGAKGDYKDLSVKTFPANL